MTVKVTAETKEGGAVILNKKRHVWASYAVASVGDMPPSAGVEQGANGAVKLKMRDQEAALLNVAKHLGMHIDRKEVSGPNGEPLTIEVKVVKPSVEIEGDVVEV